MPALTRSRKLRVHRLSRTYTSHIDSEYAARRVGIKMIRFLCKVRRPSSTNLRETRNLYMANDEAIHDGRIDLATEVDVTSNAARFYSALHRFAVSLTRNESDAADLAQQTFLILAQRLHQIRDFSQIKCWLFTTLHREFLHKIRRGRKHFEVELLPDIHDLATREPEPWRSLDGRIVLDALLRVDELRQIVKGRSGGKELEFIEQLRAYYLIPGTIVQVIQKDAASDTSQIPLKRVSRPLWTLSRFLSVRPITDLDNKIETPFEPGTTLNNAIGR